MGIEKIFNFRGENINGFDVKDRVPDPKRMTEGHSKSFEVLDFAKRMKSDKVRCPNLFDKVTALNQKLNNSTVKSY